MNPQAGFSLLEAVIATAIFGIAASTVMTISDASYRTLAHAETSDAVGNVLEEQLQAMDAETSLLPAKASGLSSDGAWAWSREATQLAAADGTMTGLALQRVVISVGPHDQADGTMISIETRHIALGEQR